MTSIKRKTHLFLLPILMACTLGLGIFSNSTPAVSQSAPPLNRDMAMRLAEINWPSSHTPAKADHFANNAILIATPCEKVWQHLIDASKWPQWYPNSRDVRIAEEATNVLREDSKFSWVTFDITIQSRVSEFVPNSRLAWFGTGEGVDAYHNWYLVPATEGCDVVTEEVLKGKGAVAMREQDPNGMHTAHQLWLTTLKTVSER